MAVRWTGVVPELLVALDRQSGEPLGLQLQRELRQAIRDGRLSAGERLPSSRSLAEHLGVSRGLVVECYEQLYAEGYVVTATGSGTRVAAGVAESRRPADSTPGSGPSVEVDFEYGIPDLAAFPMQDWLWAMSEAARTAPSAVMGDEESAGSERLREVLAAYHRRVRAGSADRADAVVVGGFRQGLNMVFAMLARQGVERVGLENPGPREHDEMVRRAGMAPVPIAVDDEGLDVASLARSGARAVLVTPAHHCPTGVVLSPERRHQLVAWADEVDGVVLEDDYDAEFRYDRQPVGSMQGLSPDRVMALGSVSKTLAPGMRIGWILSPPRLTSAIVREKHLASRGVPALDQLALARLIESGRFDRFIRRMRDVYRSRREVLVDALSAELPELELDGLIAGCHGVLRLPDALDEERVVTDALGRSVRVYGLDSYRMPDPDDDTRHSPALVIGFGNVSESRIRRGIKTLAEVIRAQ
jgi:GntR family transcriptional regulator/MocR family aminotransferase